MSNDKIILQSNQRIIKDYNSKDLVDPISKINDSIYLGQSRTTEYADILTSLGITHIVSIGHTPHSPTLMGKFNKFELKNVLDDPKEDLAKHFPNIFEFIRCAIKGGGKVYIHCTMGLSRSATVAIAFLRANGNFKSLQESYDYVKQKRHWINPNLGFKEQLSKFFMEKLK